MKQLTDIHLDFQYPAFLSFFKK